MRLNNLLCLVSAAAAAAVPCAYGFISPTTSTTKTIRRQSLSSLSATATTTLPDGLVKSVTVEGKGMPVRLGDIATVKYTCYLAGGGDDGDNTDSTFARSSFQKVVVGDGSMIEGWDKALRTMRVGERSIVRITNPNMAYGSEGIPPLIPPNAVVELDIQVLDTAEPTANIDFDSLATADNTPRTAADIAAAFEARQAARAAEGGPELEGLEAFLAKAKNFYFYGLFEGETGERPPWFLRPSITFPLAFAIVGAAFYVSLKGGAISERGAQIKDELDEIILSSNAFGTIMTALMTEKLDISI